MIGEASVDGSVAIPSFSRRTLVLPVPVRTAPSSPWSIVDRVVCILTFAVILPRAPVAFGAVAFFLVVALGSAATLIVTVIASPAPIGTLLLFPPSHLVFDSLLGGLLDGLAVRAFGAIVATGDFFEPVVGDLEERAKQVRRDDGWQQRRKTEGRRKKGVPCRHPT